ncbi:MAG TPA: hypothetical protein CFH78_04575 [Sulfurimonas sp. UBA10385]|nr:MAG: hypothetical protein A2530_00735 [Sulfurimonas sp. RIFOXYD2_FULL_34_21]DAB28036.1 MAG TPA: hypothetical protein CFH78_04575 [Sulfurimonas sp. UBA10385]
MNFGKILFFNENEGKGIIITSQKEKIDFIVNEWNDFDIMPSLGLEVVFNLKDKKALNILSKESSKLQKNEPSIVHVQQEIKPEEIIKETLKEIVSISELTQELASEIETEIETEIDTEVETEVEEELEYDDDEELEYDDESRPESITISINIATAISNYFTKIKEHLEHRSVYKKVPGSLDYVLIKRFLFTTFNNLSDIDLHIITPKIKMLYEDLKVMSSFYDDFIEKTKYPNIAYQEVFLSCQAEYVKIKVGAEHTIEKLNQLRTSEEQLDGILKVRKEDLASNIQSDEFTALQYELKSLSGAYVDMVHLMAELDERYKYDLKLLSTFEEEYKAEFSEIFRTEALFYKKDLLKVLNAQAYLLDSQLWQEAKKSKAVKAHFKDSSVSGELNTKTYLKYYLDSLDSDKATDETKKLFALYDYLISVQKDYILIVVNSALDAMEYESYIKNLKLTLDIKSFVDEKSAIKWAINNSVKVLIVEDRLQNVTVEKFLHVYKKHVSITPKIVLLGEKPKANSFSISCLLSRNASSKVVAENIKTLLTSKNN